MKTETVTRIINRGYMCKHWGNEDGPAMVFFADDADQYTSLELREIANLLDREMEKQ